MSRFACIAALLGLAAAIAAPVYGKDDSRFSRAVRDSLGVNIHFTDPQPGEMAMLSGSGLGWVRMDLAWSATEKRKGVYDFSHYDALLANLKRNHMRALLILDYGNDLYGAGGKPPYDDDGRAAFARWAVAAVKHFRGRGVLWELWNEPNGKWFWPSPSAEDYAKLALAADKAIHDAFPRETLIGPAVSGVDLSFLEGCFKAGCLQYWDAVSVHPYRQTAPETAATDYAKLRDLIAKYAPAGKTIPILAAEWGYSVSWGGFSDVRQGDYMAREFLSNLENGVPLTIWYDWHDDGTDPKNAEHNFGIVANAYHTGRDPIYDPKPAYTACAVLTKLLGGFAFERKISIGNLGDDHVLAFAHGRERRYAAWTVSDYAYRVDLPLPAGRYTIVDWQGKSAASATADASGLPLILSNTPQYILPGSPPDAR